MRTSCRFAMAVHVLSVLAYQEGDRVTSAALAESVNTNPVIIRRLLLSLQKAKLIDTCRGAGAGSRLNRSPRRINMAEIYRSVEESEPFATLTRKPDAHCPVGRSIIAVIDEIFSSAEVAMERDLAKTTLADVLQKVKTG
ncbi:MAG TPA: Rrf2 family transcriptional regulator [Verrucomicrobiae bacterium]